MALNTSYIVRVQKPKTMLADAMSEMRVWLDHNQIQLVGFNIAEDRMPGIAFDLRFRREAEASLFERTFTQPHPERRLTAHAA